MMKKLIASSRVNNDLVADLDEDVLVFALQTFITTTEKEIEAIYNNYKENNFIKIKSIAHKLAGSSIVVGLTDFSEKAKEIENAKDEEISEKLIKSLKTEFLSIQELAK